MNKISIANVHGIDYYKFLFCNNFFPARKIVFMPCAYKLMFQAIIASLHDCHTVIRKRLLTLLLISYTGNESVYETKFSSTMLDCIGKNS